MPVDTSIYNAFLQPQKSAIDYQNEFLGAQAQRQKIQQNAIGLQGAQASLADAQRVRDEQGGVRNALSALPPTATPDEQVKALRSLGTPTALTTADTLATSYGKQLVDAATATEKTSIGKKNDNETSISKHQQRLQALATVQTPEDAVQWALEGVKSGDMPSESLPIVLQKIGAAAQQPGGLDQWRQRLAQAGQTVQQQREQSAPKPTEVRLGNVVKMIDTNGYSPTYGKEIVPAQQIGQSPDNAATQAGEDRRSRAMIAKDLTVAGIGSDGAPTADVAATVKAIGEGRMAPPTLQALRNPRMASIMNQVNQQYPTFDATVYGERQKAMKDFGTGPQGQQVQAANTALNHLDTLEQLAKAQANHDIPLFNQIANRIATETGSAVPTNLQGAITLVGPEISKAVVGAGGGQGDREHVAAALQAITKGSPDQQVGQIGTMKDIFGGRLSEVGRTYQRSTHLDNFTDMLSPAAQQIYAAKHGPGAATAAATLPADIQAIIDRHGKK